MTAIFSKPKAYHPPTPATTPKKPDTGGGEGSLLGSPVSGLESFITTGSTGLTKKAKAGRKSLIGG